MQDLMTPVTYTQLLKKINDVVLEDSPEVSLPTYRTLFMASLKHSTEPSSNQFKLLYAHQKLNRAPLSCSLFAVSYSICRTKPCGYN